MCSFKMKCLCLCLCLCEVWKWWYTFEFVFNSEKECTLPELRYTDFMYIFMLSFKWSSLYFCIQSIFMCSLTIQLWIHLSLALSDHLHIFPYNSKGPYCTMMMMKCIYKSVFSSDEIDEMKWHLSVLILRDPHSVPHVKNPPPLCMK